MNRQTSERTARLASAVLLAALVAACGGGEQEGPAVTASALDAGRASTASLANDSSLTRIYMAGAKAFSDTANNPIHAWTYRAYCESGHLASGGQGSPTNGPANGVQLMDNAWFFGSGSSTLVVRTPSGNLLVFDPLPTAADMKGQVIDRMVLAGLDPTRITHVFVGNEAAAGYEGVNLVLQTYAPAAQVVATKPAADAFAARVGRGKTPSIPRRVDITVTAAADQDQGSRLIAIEQEVSVAAMLTPGASLGQMSVIVPVQHQGSTQRILVWSGNRAAQGRTDVYGSSSYFVEGFVVSQGATAWFNTQAYQGPLQADYLQLKAAPDYASNLVMGTEGVRRWVALFANCNRALAQRTNQI